MTPFANPLTHFVPKAVGILNIFSSFPAQVTTVSPHGYQPGIDVTLFIPYNNGSWNSVNGQTFSAIILDATTLDLPGLDSSEFTPWQDAPDIVIQPPGRPLPPTQITPAQIAQVVPAGEFALTLANAANWIGPNNPNG